MGFIQKGVTIEQIGRTGHKIGMLCAIAENAFKEGELDEFLRYISLNETIPMATPEYQRLLEDGPKATKRAEAIGELIRASKETWVEDAPEVDVTVVLMNLLMLLQQDERIENAKEPE